MKMSGFHQTRMHKHTHTHTHTLSPSQPAQIAALSTSTHTYTHTHFPFLGATPQTCLQKNSLPQKIAKLELSKLLRPQRPSKIVPKGDTPPKVHKLKSKAMLQLSFNFDSFLTIFEPQMGPRMVCAKRRPEGSRQPCWSLWEQIWEPFGNHLGIILGAFLCSAASLFRRATIHATIASHILRVGGCRPP